MLSSNTWEHFAITYDGKSLNFTINGTRRYLIPFNKPINTNPFDLLIGDGFIGSIDEVRIYNRSLSPEEIKAHYERRKYISPEPNLNPLQEEILDIGPPWFYGDSISDTRAGYPVRFNLMIEDDTGLSGYIFSFDNCTGSFVNDTWQSISENPYSMSVVKSINSTVGCQIGWKVYANDTTNKWNESSYSFTTTQPPQLVDVYVRNELGFLLAPPDYYGAKTSAMLTVNITAERKNNENLNISIHFSNTTLSGVPQTWNITTCLEAKECTVVLPAYKKDTKIYYYVNATDGIITEFQPSDLSNPYYLIVYEHPVAEFLIKSLRINFGSYYIVPIRVRNILKNDAVVNASFDPDDKAVFVENSKKQQTIFLPPNKEKVIYARILPSSDNHFVTLNASLYLPGGSGQEPGQNFGQGSVIIPKTILTDTDKLNINVVVPPNFPELNLMGIALLVLIAGLLYYKILKE